MRYCICRYRVTGDGVVVMGGKDVVVGGSDIVKIGIDNIVC